MSRISRAKARATVRTAGRFTLRRSPVSRWIPPPRSKRFRIRDEAQGAGQARAGEGHRGGQGQFPGDPARVHFLRQGRAPQEDRQAVKLARGPALVVRRAGHDHHQRTVQVPVVDALGGLLAHVQHGLVSGLVVVQLKTISIPSVKFDVGPPWLSRNQHWKFQVSPAATEWVPFGRGRAVRSTSMTSSPAGPLLPICFA